MNLNPQIARVTDRIVRRSETTRTAYLARIEQAAGQGPHRGELSCSNLAHGVAACPSGEKHKLAAGEQANLGIVSAYNEMLSAHQPFVDYPQLIKTAAAEMDAVAQFAGGVPAMCDGVTQGQPGMELSLFSRDVIAMSTAIALTHNMFDAAVCLGVCDKIVPGLFIGGAGFGHLPLVFVPAGPMTSGLGNAEKAAARQAYAEGKIDRIKLLEAESAAYHSPGTCTFYGTANSNQLLMEMMGLHLPGASFVNPGTPLREALTREGAQQALRNARISEGEYRPFGKMIDERVIVNALVGLLASGGSTNHTIHLVAMARAVGIQIDWDDFQAVSNVVPLLCRVYPNGSADVNKLQAAGGIQFLLRELLGAGLVHADVDTIMGQGLERYLVEPFLQDGELGWRTGAQKSLDEAVLAPVSRPFSVSGGINVMSGNLGRAIVKVSAVDDEHRVVEAPARVFDSQAEVQKAFHAGELYCDIVVVVRWQGPAANGMPELHKLTPALSSVLSHGFQAALVTDGRMSGASGKVPAAIQVSPECLTGGALARVRDGDVIRVDTRTGQLQALVDEQEWARREPASPPSIEQGGFGRELFAVFRQQVGQAEQGACTLAMMSTGAQSEEA